MVGIVDQSTADTATSTGIVVTMGGSPTNNVKGAYVEMIASTSEETYWVTLCIKGLLSEATASGFLVDFAIGAASSEVVQVNNIHYQGNTEGLTATYSFPLTIASGSRVALRCQSSNTSTPDLQCMVYLSNDDTRGTSTSNTTLGDDTSASTGTDVDPGGSANTKGAYSELDSSTAIGIDYLLVCIGNSANSSVTGVAQGEGLIDIAIGAAASEVDQLKNLIYAQNSRENSPGPYGFFHGIPSGTRVSSRCQAAAVGDANDRLIDVSVIGFKMTAPSGGSGLTAKQVGKGGMVG